MLCRIAILLSFTFAFLSGNARASVGEPDPAQCETSIDGVQRFLLCPDGLGDAPAASFTVTVKDQAGNPIESAIVEILIGGLDTGRTTICSGQQFIQNTNHYGIAMFNLGGGGCAKGEGLARIRANGVLIRSWNAVMSPDYAGWDNEGIPYRWNHVVGPEDLAAFVRSYSGGVGAASCHDYNNDGVTGPSDLAAFIAMYRGGNNSCN